MCFDETGQTRGITASELLDAPRMASIDKALQNAVQAAPVVLAMEYRMLRDDLEWMCGLGGTSLRQRHHCRRDRGGPILGAQDEGEDSAHWGRLAR